MRIRHACFRVIVAVLSVFLPVLSAAEIINENESSFEKLILSILARSLDRLGIDTAYCCSTTTPITLDRPRVAPLADYMPQKKDWGKAFGSESWAHAFNDKAFGVIVAFRNRRFSIEDVANDCLKKLPVPNKEVCDFIEQWLRSPKSSRVFLSFTRADYGYAVKVKTSLEENGYTVFTFIKGEDAAPWAEPGMGICSTRHRTLTPA